MEEEVRIARSGLERQKLQWEEELIAERARLEQDFASRCKQLEEEETKRVQRAKIDEAERRTAFEQDKKERAAREVRERVTAAKTSALNDKEQRRVDAERAAVFAAQESERAARWEAEESLRKQQRLEEQEAFHQQQAALAVENEAHKARMEAEHAAHVAHEQLVLDELREAFEQDKKEQIRQQMLSERARMQAQFDMDKTALQKIVDAERRHAEARASEDAQRIATQEVEMERLRQELEVQMRDKHAAQRQSHQRAMQVAKLEQSLEAMQAARQTAPIIRVTSNPLDVDPLLVNYAELPNVSDSVAGFARSWMHLSFRSLLALLLSMPYASIPRAMQVLRLWFATHPGAAAKVEEASGMLPLHMCAATGLYRELTDIVLREHPLALRAEDRSGALALFYSCAYRSGREESRVEIARRNAEASGPAALESALKNDELDVVTTRKQGLELIRYLMLKYPDGIYQPNRVRGAQLAAAAEAKQHAQAMALPRDAQPAAPSLALVPSSSSSSSRSAFDNFESDEDPSQSPLSLSVVEYAIDESDLALLNLLLELTSGDFLNACDSRGLSYLHRAAQQGKLVLCQWLVEIGRINPWTLCHADRTALEYVNSNRDEALALYLTREMAKVPPEGRVKARKGARRMLIREWAHQSGADERDDEQDGGQSYLGSGTGGGSGAQAARQIGRGESLRPYQPFDGSLIDPLSLTPRGASALLRPVRTGRGSLERSPEPAGPHTTHIHVYGDAARSLLAGKSLKRLANDNADEAEAAERERRSSASTTRTAPRNTYHWEFLHERPKNATLSLVGASSPTPLRSSAAGGPAKSPSASPQRSASAQQHFFSSSAADLDDRPSSSMSTADLSSPVGSPARFVRSQR